MAITTIEEAGKETIYYIGLASDTKPSPASILGGVAYVNTYFIETDTGNIYRLVSYASSGWVWRLVAIESQQLVSNQFIEAIRGRHPEQSVVNKFGAITSSGTHTTWKPICTSEAWFTPTAAVTLEAVSDDNTNDVAGGSGARAIRIYGLKTPASTEEETEDVNLNGTTAVALANQWWRIYRIKVIESGTYAGIGSYSHDSTIDVRETATPANIWAQIGADTTFGLSQSEIGCFSIPDGKTGVLLNYRIEVSDTNGSVNAIIAIRENADDVAAPFEPLQSKAIHRNMSAGKVITNDPDAPLEFITGPADVFGITRNGTNQSYDANIRMQILVID